MSEITTSSDKTSLKKSKPIPVYEVRAAASEEDKWEYKSQMQKYFLSGKPTKFGPEIDWQSLSLSSIKGMGSSSSEYPFVLKNKTQSMVSFKEYLSKLAIENLRKEDHETFMDHLTDLTGRVQDVVIKIENISNGLKLTKEVMEVLFGIREKLIEPERWIDICKSLEKEMVTDKISIIGYSAQTAFLIFSQHLKHCHECHIDFMVEINKRIAGLNDILVLHGGSAHGSEGQFDFASDFVSFNEIDEIAPLKASSKLPESRLNRIQKSYDILVDAQNTYRDYTTIVFVNKNLSKTYQLDKICDDGVLEMVDGNVCNKAKNFYNKEIQKFAMVMAAIKVADLELTQQYVEDLHDAYFKNYDVHYLGDENLRYMRSVVVIDYAQQLMQDASDFLELVSGGALINIMGINEINQMNGAIHKEEGYLELASLAFSRRKAVVYQGAVDDPAGLYNAISLGLEEPYPVLWNILIGSGEEKDKEADYDKIRAAKESRLFPVILYNVESGEGFGGHFDLSGNSQTKAVMPSFKEKVKMGEEIQDIENYLTMADFLSMYAENAPHLEIIPHWYQSEDLVSLESYLNAGLLAIDGKIPYIRAIDKDNKLHKIAIPISWVIFCRKRLDYWRFLQELGGVNNPLVETAIQRVKISWAEEQATRLNELESRLHSEFEQLRSDDLEKAIRRMLYRLMKGELDLNTLAVESGDVNIQIDVPSIQEKEEPKSVDNQSEAESEKTKQVSPEVWVESDECTSCNDCIDAVPGVFKYNDDKQAFVHNPKGAAYAKIVSAAEKCPAACIHPGLPHDKSEPNLEKLTKRAEKFN